MRPIKSPSFVYRQDGHELSYLVVAVFYTKSGEMSSRACFILSVFVFGVTMGLASSEAGRCQTIRRLSPSFRGVILLCPLSTGKGGDKVNAVTYEELFQLLLVLIAFASLIFQITKKK